jgi:hypothetical protein
MLTRATVIRLSPIIALFVPIAALAMSWGFRIHAVGRLGGSLRFEFRDDSDRKTIKVGRFIVSERTPDHRWKAVWSIAPRREVAAIEYGVLDVDAEEKTPAKALTPGRVYAAFASARGGGSAMMVFRFDKHGRMTFPESLD